MTVRRCTADSRGRVRYWHGEARLIPEQLVLRRWKERSNQVAAKTKGVRFDGCRLPPGTWSLLDAWLAGGLNLQEVTDATILQQYIAKSRAAGVKLRTPEAKKFAMMLSWLRERGVLSKLLNRQRRADAPGIPDLFLWRVDRTGRVHDGRFVEVKRWDRRARRREHISGAQKEELAFLRGLGLSACVVYLLE